LQIEYLLIPPKVFLPLFEEALLLLDCGVGTTVEFAFVDYEKN
jgi:hypothetical protein